VPTSWPPRCPGRRAVARQMSSRARTAWRGFRSPGYGTERRSCNLLKGALRTAQARDFLLGDRLWDELQVTVGAQRDAGRVPRRELRDEACDLLRTLECRAAHVDDAGHDFLRIAARQRIEARRVEVDTDRLDGGLGEFVEQRPC